MGDSRPLWRPLAENALRPEDEVAMRIPNTIDRVQSPPGVPSRPSLKAWTIPIISAPRTAPVRLPMPPSTAAVNAIRPSSSPVS